MFMKGIESYKTKQNIFRKVRDPKKVWLSHRLIGRREPYKRMTKYMFRKVANLIILKISDNW